MLLLMYVSLLVFRYLCLLVFFCTPFKGLRRVNKQADISENCSPFKSARTFDVAEQIPFSLDFQNILIKHIRNHLENFYKNLNRTTKQTYLVTPDVTCVKKYFI